MKKVIFIFAVCIFLFRNLSIAQSNLDVDLNLISSCVACHGPNGISPNEDWPNLAGQKKNYIIIQLKNFKQGQRVNILMSPISKMLNENQMEDLANYYSNLGLK